MSCCHAGAWNKTSMNPVTGFIFFVHADYAPAINTNKEQIREKIKQELITATK